MRPLTPTATAVLEALRDGPAATPTLRTRINCGRSTLDKALAELARNQLVERLPGTHPDQPNQWTLTPEPPSPVAAPADEPHDPPTGPQDDDAAAATDPDPDEEPGPHPATEEPADDPEPEPGQPAQPRAEEDGGGTTAPDDEIKICRGCHNQLPKICPTCWAKTSSYCGTCRRTMPARNRDGAPEILSNGLPKLARGQLAGLVQDVMRAHPLPDHLGITGWTSGRIAVYLPGRSTGAIGNVLDKLAATGIADQLGDNPKRYRLHDTTTPGPEAPAGDAAATLTPADTGDPDAPHPDPEPATDAAPGLSPSPS